MFLINKIDFFKPNFLIISDNQVNCLIFQFLNCVHYILIIIFNHLKYPL